MEVNRDDLIKMRNKVTESLIEIKNIKTQIDYLLIIDKMDNYKEDKD